MSIDKDKSKIFFSVCAASGVMYMYVSIFETFTFTVFQVGFVSRFLLKVNVPKHLNIDFPTKNHQFPLGGEGGGQKLA